MLQQIQQTEAQIIATVRAATAALDAVGTGTDLASALAALQASADAAKARLQSSADAARATVASLAFDVGNLAASLSADLFATVATPAVPEVAPEPVAVVDPAPAVEPVNYRTADALDSAEAIPTVATVTPDAPAEGRTLSTVLVTIAANAPVAPPSHHDACHATLTAADDPTPTPASATPQTHASEPASKPRRSGGRRPKGSA